MTIEEKRQYIIEKYNKETADVIEFIARVDTSGALFNLWSSDVVLFYKRDKVPSDEILFISLLYKLIKKEENDNI